MDTGNRSFAAMVGAGLLAGMLLICGAVGSVLVALVAERVARDGSAALTTDARELAPALAFMALVCAGVAAAARSALVQLRASRRLARRVGELERPAPEDLRRAAAHAGLDERIVLVECDERFSFAYGALRPRVAISTGLVRATSPRELDAVLQHERDHVRNLDPLKVLVARAVPSLFFYLPVFGALQARYVAGRELAADRRAAARCGRTPLAGALLKVVRGPAWPELSAAAAIGAPELLDARVAQLETGVEPPPATIGRGVLAGTLAAALGLACLFAASVVGLGGPGEVARVTGAGLGASDLGDAALCAAPWAGGLWLGRRWLRRKDAAPA